MMHQVWKYPCVLGLFDPNITIEMPRGAKLLHFAAQDGVPHVWALVDVHEKQMVPRRFRLVGTGHDIEQDLFQYVGTVLLLADHLVFHLFELP